MVLTGVCAVDKNGCLGKENQIPWMGKYPEDMKFFKSLTLDTTIVYGRKTYESIGSKPLPKRNNVILTSNPPLEIPPNTYFVKSKEELSEKLFSLKEPHYCIGGSSIFKLLWDRLYYFYITHIDTEVVGGDTFIPKEIFTEFEVINEIVLSDACKVKKYKRL